MTKSVSKTAVAAVAAGAAASIGSNSALADPMAAGDQPYYLSLEGSAIFADPAIDKFGGGFSGSGITFDRDNFGVDKGYRGAAAFGRKIDDTNDWRIGIAYSNFLKNSASLNIASGGGSGGSISGSANTNMSYLVGDLELGHNVRPADQFDLRLFAGLRAVNSDHSLDKLGQLALGGSGQSFSGEINTEFLGIGPRAGFDFSSRIGEGMFGISGMAAASILFGKLEQNGSSTRTSGGISSGSSFSDSENRSLVNLEAALGADFHVTENSVLTIGYRAEYWESLRGEDKSGSLGPLGSLNQEGDLLSHGPFVKFIANF